MRFSKKSLIVVPALIVAMAFVPASQAQVNSNTANINLTATLGESVTVVATPAAPITFALIPNGTVNGSANVSVTTSWALAKTRTSVKLYAYFASVNALTDGTGDNIPTTNVTGSVNGTAAAPFTTAGPFGANGMMVFNQAIGAAGTFNFAHGPDTIGLAINTTGLALPAATYTGVLNIQAQAL
jgi:hypothetical protein